MDCPDYYKIPENITELQDLIEEKNMNFSRGEIFKAVYRWGKTGKGLRHDLEKIIYFASRELARLED